jgi:hypothetical protein
MSSIREQAGQFRRQILRSEKLPPLYCAPWMMWKYFFRWRRDLQEKHSSVADEMMWVTYPAIRFLKKNLRREMAVFEYGGGGSSLFFANRVSELATVEHDKEWFERFSVLLNAKAEIDWNGMFVAPEKGAPSGDPGDPKLYISDDKESAGFNFRAYASAIDAYPDEHFDLVLVDGRARPSCMMHAIPKVKRGGWLVLDNSERDYYLTKVQLLLEGNFKVVVDGMAPVPFSPSFSRTTIWRKK